MTRAIVQGAEGQADRVRPSPDSLIARSVRAASVIRFAATSSASGSVPVARGSWCVFTNSYQQLLPVLSRRETRGAC